MSFHSSNDSRTLNVRFRRYKRRLWAKWLFSKNQPNCILDEQSNNNSTSSTVYIKMALFSLFRWLFGRFKWINFQKPAQLNIRRIMCTFKGKKRTLKLVLFEYQRAKLRSNLNCTPCISQSLFNFSMCASVLLFFYNRPSVATLNELSRHRHSTTWCTGYKWRRG